MLAGEKKKCRTSGWNNPSVLPLPNLGQRLALNEAPQVSTPHLDVTYFLPESTCLCHLRMWWGDATVTHRQATVRPGSAGWAEEQEAGQDGQHRALLSSLFLYGLSS